MAGSQKQLRIRFVQIFQRIRQTNAGLKRATVRHIMAGGVQMSTIYTTDPSWTVDKVKHQRKKKFEPKEMLWNALSPKGISTPVLTFGRGMAVNTDHYVPNCSEPHLIPL